VKGARLLAGAGVDAAAGVDPLHRRDARQRAAAAMRRYLDLEPGDIARRLPATLATALPTTALPSRCSQFGPA